MAVHCYKHMEGWCTLLRVALFIVVINAVTENV